jgi:hypothetical protein
MPAREIAECIQAVMETESFGLSSCRATYDETRKVRQTRRGRTGRAACEIPQTDAERQRSRRGSPPEQLAEGGSGNAGVVDLDEAEGLVLGVFEGVPTTRKGTFDLPGGPDRIVLYQKNIEAVCSNEAEIRREIHLTVVHELGHYFGMTEAQLEDV